MSSDPSLLHYLADLRNIGNSFMQAIVLTDPDGIILYLNKANEELFEISSAEAIGRSIFEFTTGNNNAIQNAASLKANQQRNTFHGIATIKSNGRQTLQYSTTIFNELQELMGYLITDQDIKKFLNTMNILEDSENRLISDKELSEKQREFFLTTNRLLHGTKPMLTGCNNKKFQAALKLALQTAKSDVTVLLLGETGCGKEVFSNYIQNNSLRNDKPFIKINCSAIPSNLLESELFGYMKGAYTGADIKGKAGYFELADGGTILLDEIGELPLAFQAKLLRVLQDQTVYRVGATTPTDIDVRMIFATNRNLKEMVKNNTFREDLYYRINIFPIHIPPLRERPEDIADLIHYFLDDFNKKYNKHVSLGPSVYFNLKKYAWPGNVRELQNILERWVIIFDTFDVIHWNQVAATFTDSDYMHYYTDEDRLQAQTYTEIMDEYQREILLWAKSQYKTTREMAKALNLDHSTICKKAKRLGINLNDFT